MFCEIYRPETLEEALHLLARQHPRTIPLAAGTDLDIDIDTEDELAALDLGGLGLNQIERYGNILKLGSMLTRSALSEASGLPPGLVEAARDELHDDLHGAATLGGTIVSTDGSSLLVALLQAMDAQLLLEPDSISVSLGEFLVTKGSILPWRLITGITLTENVSSTARRRKLPAPSSVEILAAVAQWPSGRVRAVLGGPTPEPILAFDGPTASGLAEASFDRFCQFRVGAEATEESTAASELVLSCLEALNDQIEVEDG